MSTVQVLGDTILPSISISETSIDCDSQFIIVTISTDALSPTYSWTGPNGFMSTLQNPIISSIGMYTCEVTGSNGCSNSESYELPDIFNYSEVITTTEASGTTGGTAEITLTGGTDPFLILWDNGDVGTQASKLSIGTHTVSVEDALECMQVFTFEIFMSTSTADLSFKSFEVSPNPAYDHVMVSWIESRLNPSQITVFDITGQSMLEIKVDKENHQLLDISSLPKGIYLIQLTDYNQRLVSKLTKI